jgi:hypothetical protein
MTFIGLLVDVTSHESCVQSLVEIQSFIQKNNLPFVSLVNNAGVSRKNPVEFHDLDDAVKIQYH